MSSGCNYQNHLYVFHWFLSVFMCALICYSLHSFSYTTVDFLLWLLSYSPSPLLLPLSLQRSGPSSIIIFLESPHISSRVDTWPRPPAPATQTQLLFHGGTRLLIACLAPPLLHTRQTPPVNNTGNCRPSPPPSLPSVPLRRLVKALAAIYPTAKVCLSTLHLQRCEARLRVFFFFPL